MFKINKKKRIFVSAFVTIAVILPAAIFAANNLAKTNDSYAYGEVYGTMREAAVASGFGNSDNITNLWGCVVRGKYGNSISSGDTRYLTSMSPTELATITTLDCTGSDSNKVTDINGLSQLTGLKVMKLGNQAFPSINLKYFPDLEYVDLSLNTSLHTVSDGDVQDQGNVYLTPSKKTKLTTFYLNGDTSITKVKIPNISALSTVNFANMTNLNSLEITNTNVGPGLDLSSDTSLQTIRADNMNISTTVKIPSSAREVNLSSNNLANITLPSTCSLVSLNLRDNPNLSAIGNLNRCANLESLAIINDNFSSIDISSNTKLVALKAKGNTNLTNVSITNNKLLQNIQLGTSSSNDGYYISVGNVDSIIQDGNVVYDFSDYSFINSNTSFASSSNYSISGSGKILTVTNYDGLEVDSNRPYVHVRQTSTPVEDTNVTNDGPLTFVNNYYRVRLADAEVPSVSTYTLTFNANGGTGAPSNRVCSGTGSCQVTIPTGTPTRNGYTFLGWAATAGATAPSSSYEAGSTVTLTGDKTIYAVWKENSTEPTTKTLTYNANGGTNAPESASCSGVGACDVTITSDKPTRDGYTFLGWSPSQDATNPVYTAGDVRALADDLTLYAVWEANSGDANAYVLAFDANKGSGAPLDISCQNATSCSATIPDTKPTRTGYIFKGWATTADATEATYKPGDSIVIAENTTLYAVWAAVNSGSGVVTPDTGAAAQGGANGFAEVLTAMPVIALGVFFGTKLYRGRKSHIKFD